MRGEAVKLTEGVGNFGQRLPEVRRDNVLVGNIVGNFPQAVHIVRKRQESGLDGVARQHAEGVANHGRAGDLAERADVRKPRGSVTRFEENLGLPGLFDAGDQFARFLERPGLGKLGRGAQRFIGHRCSSMEMAGWRISPEAHP